jgi:hypothetical protein
MGDLYPNLGFDPCPGDLAGYEALAAHAGRSAATLTSAVTTLANAGSDQWRGQAADAFRAHVHTEVLPVASKAAGSVGQAATALQTWAATLAGLQGEARALDRQAAPYQEQLTAVLRSTASSATVPASALPSSMQPPPAAKLGPAQQAQLDEANAALTMITARAGDIHARYLAAVRQTGSHLANAGNMAPPPPGFFAGLWHDAESRWDDVAGQFSHLVHDRGLLEFISGVANVVATVAGLLALIPVLSVICAPIALGAAGIALLSDAVLAEFDHGSWGAVILDAGAVVGGAGWIKAASKLTEIFKASGLSGLMTEAPTWWGMASKIPLITKIPVIGKAIDEGEKTVEVAPGLFRMIGATLKTAAGDTKDLDALSAVKKFDDYAKWRGVDIVSGLVTWTFSGAGIEAIPSTVRTWVNNVAAGKDPWQEPADAAG